MRRNCFNCNYNNNRQLINLRVAALTGGLEEYIFGVQHDTKSGNQDFFQQADKKSLTTIVKHSLRTSKTNCRKTKIVAGAQYRASDGAVTESN
jgi:hypothetical protein